MARGCAPVKARPNRSYTCYEDCVQGARLLQSTVESLRRRLTEARLSKVSRDVRRQGLTYLSPDKLLNLERCLATLRREKITGDCLEAGIALGGSAIVICSLMGPRRRWAGYDVFGMIPPPGEADGEDSHARYQTILSGQSKGLGGGEYYGYQDDLYGTLLSTFKAFGQAVDGQRVSLHRGLFEDTLRFSDEQRIAFAHIDCDWHDPVKLCLERIHPVLQNGGFIVADDYHDYDGCRRAVHDFLSDKRDMRIVNARGNLVMRRTAA